jgi:hypothetical protein
MKLIVKETNDTKAFRDMPISYRVSLEINRDIVTLEREYFRCGFNDGEQYDDFYFDNEWSGRQGRPLYRCTFITKRIDDKKYLMEKEQEMIKLFYDKCAKSKKNLQKELILKTKELNDNINNYDDILNYLEYTQRGKKLKKLKNKLR